MLTEIEIDAIIKDDELRSQVYELKKKFLQQEAPYMEICDEDFLGLLILLPSVKIALADGTVSFFEELRLQRKARKYSKGKYFLKKDPINVAMHFLIKNYSTWEIEFFDVLREVLNRTFHQNDMMRSMLQTGNVSSQQLHKDLLNAPLLFTGMMTSFFVNKDDELIKSKNISRNQFECIKEIGELLGLIDLPLFQKFIATYSIKA